MTTTERDKLAVKAGAESKLDSLGFAAYYLFPDTTCIVKHDWHPESSRDDCDPLLEEIKRRGLKHQFLYELAKLLGRKWPGIKEFTEQNWIDLYWTLLTIRPADIVAAFLKTMEAADAAEKESQT